MPNDSLPRVIVYGTVCLDRFVFPGSSDAPPLDFPGGEGFNTAAALAGWGIPVTLTGTAIGSDAEGILLRELLRTHPLAQGIDLSLLHFADEATTPVCTVRVDAQGERFMSGRGFQQAQAPPLDALLPRLENGPLFTVDPNLGRAASDVTLAAFAAGCRIVSMDCVDRPEILAVSEVAITSREWLRRIGIDRSIEDASHDMIDAGAITAIVTDGANGGIERTRDTHRIYSAAPVAKYGTIVDTTGAGDTFRAGILYSLATGTTQARTLRFAAAAAALHCTTFGGGSRFLLESVRQLATGVRVKCHSVP